MNQPLLPPETTVSAEVSYDELAQALAHCMTAEGHRPGHPLPQRAAHVAALLGTLIFERQAAVPLASLDELTLGVLQSWHQAQRQMSLGLASPPLQGQP